MGSDVVVLDVFDGLAVALHVIVHLCGHRRPRGRAPGFRPRTTALRVSYIGFENGSNVPGGTRAVLSVLYIDKES